MSNCMTRSTGWVANIGTIQGYLHLAQQSLVRNYAYSELCEKGTRILTVVYTKEKCHIYNKHNRAPAEPHIEFVVVIIVTSDHYSC